MIQPQKWIPRLCGFTLVFFLLAAPLVAQDQKESTDKSWKTLSGFWQCQSATLDGQAVPKQVVEKTTLKMEAGKYIAGTAAGEQKGEIELNTETKPHQMKIGSNLGGTKMIIRAIYKFEKDQLILCYSFDEKFPTEFKSTDENGYLLAVYKKAKPKQ